jgi:hypothetical protein
MKDGDRGENALEAAEATSIGLDERLKSTEGSNPDTKCE